MAAVTLSALDDLLATWAADPRLVHVERLGARAARHAELARPLPPAIAECFGDPFFSHQAAAIDALRDGTSVAVATGTASGKSRCYQVPIAEAVATGLRPATALLVFPTKALAQDQLRALTELDVPRLVAATYDGDTGPEERTWVRANANVVLTNPEMLHHGMLPHHARWATFLLRLQYVVVDELHLLRGVFGSHVAHLLRRLRRLCRHYGADPTFVFTSATIGEPGRLASELCGLPVTEITDDGSPRGERLFALWNPQRAEEARASSANRDTAAHLATLVERGHRSIAFCRSRKGTELVAADARRRLPSSLADTVRPYRAGYLTAERRETEAELFSGSLRGVVTTNALELGVDIGGLDACVLDGFPGTVASLWQQAGRAGRSGQQSLALLVAGEDQLDQWFMAHPHEVFTRPPEPAVINPANPFVALPQLACAAYELPLTPADERWWPGLLDDTVRELVVADQLRIRPATRRHDPKAVWSGGGLPSHRVGLRSGSVDEVRIALADGTLIGTVDTGRAPRVVHPGAIYLHRGQAYRVRELDLDDGAAIVETHDGGEYTQPRAETELSILSTTTSGTADHLPVGVTLGLGDVRVRSRVTGYKRHDVFTGELLGIEELFLPPGELVTRGFWWAVEPRVLVSAGIDEARWPGTLHAVEHAAIGMLPLFTICDRWDVGGVSTPLQADTGRPTIVIHDAYPGGAGLAELGFARAAELLAATRELIASCGCTDGCPSCVQSPKCGNGNEPLDKAGALALLDVLVLSAPHASPQPSAA